MAQHIELKTSGISWGKKVDREVRRLWNDQKNYTDDEMTRDENLYGKNGLFKNIVNFSVSEFVWFWFRLCRIWFCPIWWVRCLCSFIIKINFRNTTNHFENLQSRVKDLK